MMDRFVSEKELGLKSPVAEQGKVSNTFKNDGFCEDGENEDLLEARQLEDSGVNGAAKKQGGFGAARRPKKKGSHRQGLRYGNLHYIHPSLGSNIDAAKSTHDSSSVQYSRPIETLTNGKSSETLVQNLETDSRNPQIKPRDHPRKIKGPRIDRFQTRLGSFEKTSHAPKSMSHPHNFRKRYKNLSKVYHESTQTNEAFDRIHRLDPLVKSLTERLKAPELAVENGILDDLPNQDDAEIEEEYDYLDDELDEAFDELYVDKSESAWTVLEGKSHLDELEDLFGLENRSNEDESSPVENAKCSKEFFYSEDDERMDSA